MNSLTRRLLQVALALVVLGGMIVIAPRAASSAAAAFVLITNTTANPAITKDVTTNASTMVTLTTPYFALVNNQDGDAYHHVNMHQTGVETGYATEEYVVPDGYKFVVTEINITPEASGTFSMYLRYTASGSSHAFDLFRASGAETHQFRFTAGPVYPSGSHVVIESLSSTYGLVGIHGYLTAN